jgi:16S rRNA (cytidine1402-2'-O)-methyltransferase
VVATPLGHLADLSPRAADTLRRVAAIAAEDTRTSAVLLAAHGIATRMFAAHDHNEARVATQIVERVAAGEAIALISDAGTPAVSDPGARIVRAMHEAALPVIPVPGPSACIAALSAAGFEGAFLFAGFLPSKRQARRSAIQAITAVPATLVFYESPHRIEEAAADLVDGLGPGRRAVVARELTKRFETIRAMPLGDLPAWLAAHPDNRRGEFVLVVEGAPATAIDNAESDRVLALLLEELPVKSAARLAAAITGGSKNALYDRALAMKSARDDPAT